MLAILIVEDRPMTLKQLRDYLAYEFPYAILDTASTVKDALEVIEATSRLGVRYKVVILDFKLPKDWGENPEIDTTLRRRLRESTSRDAVVFHITAYPDSPEIVHYLREEQTQYPHAARPVVLSKLDENWTEKLYDFIRRVIHSDRITARLDALFGGEADWPNPAAGRQGGPTHCDATQELAALRDDLEAHWRYLDDRLKSRVGRYFRISEEGSTVKMSLLGE